MLSVFHARTLEEQRGVVCFLLAKGLHTEEIHKEMV